MKSKIGIVICGLMGEKQFVSDAYIKAVEVGRRSPDYSAACQIK